jgi:hypothetical protein
MSTETDKYENQIERETPHSAFAEFSRDERRPAVMLLAALILAAIFFAIGIMFGRWTAEPHSRPDTTPGVSTQTAPPPPATGAPQPQPASAQTTAPPRPTDDKQQGYTLLIADLKSNEAASALVESLERAGYKDVRIRPRTSAPDSQFSILIGHYTRDEALAEAARLKDKGGPRMRNVRVIADPAD